MWTINDLIKAGMEFFTGKTVLASTLEAKETELKTAAEKVAALEKDLKEAKAAVATLTTERDTAQSALTTRTTELATANTKIGELEKAAKSVSQTAQEITAAQGIPAAQLPETPAPGAATGDLIAQRAALKTPEERAAFDARHSKELLALAQSEIRKELRNRA